MRRSTEEKLKPFRESMGMVFEKDDVLPQEKPLGENDRFRFYRNWICEGIEDMLHSPDKEGLTLGDHGAFMAVDKETGDREYAIYDGDGHIRCVAKDLFDADVKVRILKMQLQESLDLRNIAESGELPKVV